MNLEVDHIFIVSHQQGAEADELVKMGLTESPGRIHPGQGTRNRKFYFENFFLEILWVHDEDEARLGFAREVGLYQRCSYRGPQHSRFGLGLTSRNSDSLFRNSLKMIPPYFRDSPPVDVIWDPHLTQLPWIFRIPAKFQQNQARLFPAHSLGLTALTDATFQFQKSVCRSLAQRLFQPGGQVHFTDGFPLNVTLTFDHGQQGKILSLACLDLIMRY